MYTELARLAPTVVESTNMGDTGERVSGWWAFEDTSTLEFRETTLRQRGVSRSQVLLHAERYRRDIVYRRGGRPTGP